MISSNRPARHQKTTSHDGASRPRNDRSSTARSSFSQRRFDDTIGDGQKTDSSSSVTNAAAA
jgi:hypothetical protein